MKTVSCGIIITDGKRMLGCLPTGRQFKDKNCLDLPKGRSEEGEDHLTTAVRECKEETGLILNPKALTPLGVFAYRPTKDLSLFIYTTDKLPDLKGLHCDAVFEDRHGNVVPEHNGFEYVELTNLHKRFFAPMVPVLLSALNLWVTKGKVHGGDKYFAKQEHEAPRFEPK